jgi:hypothetical protein
MDCFTDVADYREYRKPSCCGSVEIVARESVGKMLTKVNVRKVPTRPYVEVLTVSQE